jgi:small subunit ribosomal protein S5
MAEENAKEKMAAENVQTKAAEEKPKAAEEKGRPHFDARRRPDRKREVKDDENKLLEKVITISRVAKVVKGGKRFSFNALVVVGDGKGHAGWGFGKANEVPEAIRKSLSNAHKNMFTVPMKGDTIPHEVQGKFKAGVVMLKPAGPGTGVIAGGPVRALCEVAGIRDILTKCMGSRNKINVVKATIEAFKKLRLYREV